MQFWDNMTKIGRHETIRAGQELGADIEKPGVSQCSIGWVHPPVCLFIPSLRDQPFGLGRLGSFRPLSVVYPSILLTAYRFTPPVTDIFFYPNLYLLTAFLLFAMHDKCKFQQVLAQEWKFRGWNFSYLSLYVERDWVPFVLFLSYFVTFFSF